jgi:hypothetical protein
MVLQPKRIMSYAELFEDGNAKKRRKKNEKFKAKSVKNEELNKSDEMEALTNRTNGGQDVAVCEEPSRNLVLTDWNPESDELPVVSGKNKKVCKETRCSCQDLGWLSET